MHQNESVNRFQLDEKKGYFTCQGVNVMAFDDIYPVGHQAGVGIIMHGNRVATNGDLRFEQTPGQWQPVPKQLDRKLDIEDNSITTLLQYPDEAQHLKGFNPLIYPDVTMTYSVRVTGVEKGIKVTLDLDREIPEQFLGKACFNLELVPGPLFGKPWIMDDKQGIFPRQANGPTLSQKANIHAVGHFAGVEERAVVEELTAEEGVYSPMIADDIIAAPYAVGRKFTIRPEDPYNRITIESNTSDLRLYDGRMNHNNGWFVISSEIPAGATKGAIEWIIRPNVVEDWLYTPVVQVSQVGYLPNQPKWAVVELDRRDDRRQSVSLVEITEDGAVPVATQSGEELLLQDSVQPDRSMKLEVQEWGDFLRYRYLRVDFTQLQKEGLYQVKYGDRRSAIFRIAEDVLDRGVWQPVLEYFLPVQMCHMRVQEKYRVWHGHCHADDAQMAPLNRIHVDGYEQGPKTMTHYKPGDVVPGLDKGGWHDAGDHDLRVESQAGECYILAMAYECFGVDYDATTIDQNAHLVEIHQPDGKNDILQQIEHGMLSVLGGYQALGRLYRGIIARSVRKYVLLGDMSQMTKGIKGDNDDRWVFTEDNPLRELQTAGWLAGAARALRGFNDTLSKMAVEVAKELFAHTGTDLMLCSAKLFAAAELWITTGEEEYRNYLINQIDFICNHFDHVGWVAARVDKLLQSPAFSARIQQVLPAAKAKIEELCQETPYGIPYKPYIWGAGWNIQALAFQYYFLQDAYPEYFKPDLIYHAMDFVLGCHPGSNTASFASGVGARSATVAYGMNRADWSYIPGGVISGTALIRPDFPELLEFPYLWQQTEYVLGGGSSNYMFMVLAAQQLLKK